MERETPEERRGLYGQRPSRSHDALRRKQFARIALLTPIERMIEALELSEGDSEPEDPEDPLSGDA